MSRRLRCEAGPWRSFSSSAARQQQPGSLAHLNMYSPARWRPLGPKVRDVAQFERAVAEAVARVGKGVVVSYHVVATEAGYPTRAKAVAQFLARSGRDLPWWRVVRADGYLSHPDAEAQARALRLEGVVVDGRRVRNRLPPPGTGRHQHTGRQFRAEDGL